MAIEIHEIGGNCPVQAEGMIDGVPFYFRARGKRWSLEIGPNASIIESEWSHSEKYSDKEYAAGWMSVDEAKALIAKGAEIYRTEKAQACS